MSCCFEALGEIRNALHEKISSWMSTFGRMQLECAENTFQQQRDALTNCLEGIDQQVIKLAVYIDEDRRLYAKASMRKRFSIINRSGC